MLHAMRVHVNLWSARDSHAGLGVFAETNFCSDLAI